MKQALQFITAICALCGLTANLIAQASLFTPESDQLTHANVRVIVWGLVIISAILWGITVRIHANRLLPSSPLEGMTDYMDALTAVRISKWMLPIVAVIAIFTLYQIAQITSADANSVDRQQIGMDQAGTVISHIFFLLCAIYSHNRLTEKTTISKK